MIIDQLISKAKRKGIPEATFIKSLECMAEALEHFKDIDAKTYWKYMRKLHGTLCDYHYDEYFANHDVDQMEYTDANGIEHVGPHWTKSEINQLTSHINFPNDVNEWDKYVAFNAAYSDFCSKFKEDQDIINIGNLFFFRDEDWPNTHKVWDYFYSKCKL